MAPANNNCIVTVGIPDNNCEILLEITKYHTLALIVFIDEHFMIIGNNDNLSIILVSSMVSYRL